LSAIILIPNYGVLSAAWVTAGMMIAQNIVLMCLVKNRVGFWMIGFRGMRSKS